MPRQPETGNRSQETPAGSGRIRVLRLKKRADFVRAARGARAAAPGLVLQCRPSPETAEPDAVRVGFTATKKLGGAVVRNRVKRRLRAAAARVMPERAQPGHDYVLIGRSGTAARPFKLLIEDLKGALRRVHRPSKRGQGGDSRKPGQGVNFAKRRVSSAGKR